ncbi:MAG TPA: hypothetical protein VG498_11225 [Terriglobales bacterium]|nr:hypothetical protein [Terriglobales bacterium]
MSRLFILLNVFGLMTVALAQAPAPAATRMHASPAIVVGFVGGFVHADDLRHSEVQLVQKLQSSYGDDVTVRIFENHRRAGAHKLILQLLDRIGNAFTSAEDKQHANLILFGHSWGASAVVSLARELEKEGIAVTLTIQVDSIAKNGEDDSLIPANVAEAINFYQTKGILHGRRKITAADPSRTRILGNFMLTYDQEPAECHSYPWYNRFLFKGHTSIECDPQVWSRIDSLIRLRLPAVSRGASKAGGDF